MPTDNNSQGQVSQAANGSNIRQLVNSTYIEALTGEALNPVAWPKAGGLISVARMLRASSSPVPFEDRSGILDSLIAWAHQDHGFSVQVIGGAGGTGKTRLGVELCRRLSAKPDGETPGWNTGFLKNDASEESIEGLACESVPRLVIVDYAESRREQVAALLRACMSSDSTAPIRIVLLVRQPRSYIARDRTAAAWVNAIRPDNDEAVDQLLDEAENSVLLLDESPLIVADRESLFKRARNTFHTADDLNADFKFDLSEDLYKQPLMIVMAGYLAALGDESEPSSAHEMFEAILRHEAQYWHRSAHEQKLYLNGNELAELVAVATLTDVDDKNEAENVLALLPHNNAREVQRARTWLSKLYHNDSSSFWNPLEPDRLGEHLVATRLIDHPEILRWALDPSRSPEQLVRPLMVISRAARSDGDFPNAAAQALNTTIVGLAGKAIRIASDPALYDIRTGFPDALARVLQILGPKLKNDLLKTASNSLPSNNHLLLELAFVISSELVKSDRRLASANPTAYQPDLATSLNNLGNRLSELGRREEALTPTHEAVNLRRVLAKQNPAAYLPDLAISLNNLGISLSELGRREEALTPTQEAVNIRRVLAKALPAVFSAPFARSLRLLEYILTKLERHEEAEGIRQELEELRNQHREKD